MYEIAIPMIRSVKSCFWFFPKFRRAVYILVEDPHGIDSNVAITTSCYVYNHFTWGLEKEIVCFL